MQEELNWTQLLDLIQSGEETNNVTSEAESEIESIEEDVPEIYDYGIDAHAVSEIRLEPVRVYLLNSFNTQLNILYTLEKTKRDILMHIDCEGYGADIEPHHFSFEQFNDILNVVSDKSSIYRSFDTHPDIVDAKNTLLKSLINEMYSVNIYVVTLNGCFSFQDGIGVLFNDRLPVAFFNRLILTKEQDGLRVTVPRLWFYPERNSYMTDNMLLNFAIPGMFKLSTSTINYVRNEDNKSYSMPIGQVQFVKLGDCRMGEYIQHRTPLDEASGAVVTRANRFQAVMLQRQNRRLTEEFQEMMDTIERVGFDEFVSTRA